MITSTPAKNACDLFLEPRYLAIVQQILSGLLPGVPVWAFGSRATGRNLWRCSDLDLAVGKELNWTTRGLLSEALEESLLPMNVDVVELPIVNADFVDRIQRDFVVVQGADSVVARADGLVGQQSA